MNRDESVADKYLRSLGRGVPIFEPEGRSKPPVFSLENTIGIEVRRLNQNYFGKMKPEGLEEVEIPLHKGFEKVLRSINKRSEKRTYWVYIEYKRPLGESIKVTKERMLTALTRFLDGARDLPARLRVTENIFLQVRPSVHVVPNTVFRPFLTSAGDSGSGVIEMYSENLSYCIGTKDRKIAPIRHRYKEWWLVLVDTMFAWNLEGCEIAEIKKRVVNTEGFDEVVLVDFTGTNCLLRIRRQI